jgi:hypothetical protein
MPDLFSRFCFVSGISLDQFRAMAVQRETLPAIMSQEKTEVLKHAQQTNKALKAIITILYKGTEVDLMY